MRLVLSRFDAMEFFNTTTDGIVIYPYEKAKMEGGTVFDFTKWKDIAYLPWPYSCYSIIRSQDNGKFPINFIILKEIVDRILASGDMQDECWKKLSKAPVFQNTQAKTRYLWGY